jgi:hypothetical protein
MQIKIFETNNNEVREKFKIAHNDTAPYQNKTRCDEYNITQTQKNNSETAKQPKYTTVTEPIIIHKMKQCFYIFFKILAKEHFILQKPCSKLGTICRPDDDWVSISRNSLTK